jgi:hypothetical protein
LNYLKEFKGKQIPCMKVASQFTKMSSLSLAIVMTILHIPYNGQLFHRIQIQLHSMHECRVTINNNVVTILDILMIILDIPGNE